MPLTPNDADILQAHIQAVDATAREYEAEWGVERLPLLVPPALAARFFTASRQWSEAIEGAYNADILTRDMLDLVDRKSAALIRGWKALAAAASEAGHRPVRPEIWEIRLHDGTIAALVQTNAEVAAARQDGRHLAVYTLEEIANIIAALPSTLTQAKTIFEGAKFNPPRDHSWVRYGDPIPF